MQRRSRHVATPLMSLPSGGGSAPGSSSVPAGSRPSGLRLVGPSLAPPRPRCLPAAARMPRNLPAPLFPATNESAPSRPLGASGSPPHQGPRGRRHVSGPAGRKDHCRPAAAGVVEGGREHPHAGGRRGRRLPLGRPLPHRDRRDLLSQAASLPPHRYRPRSRRRGGVGQRRQLG
jgi:hypothetical protein